MYLFRPGDVLDVKFKNLMKADLEIEELSNKGGGNSGMMNQQNASFLMGYRVDLEGNVELPLLGNIQVEGLNWIEAQEKIRSKLNLIVDHVSVNLEMLSYKITVLGEVNQVGEQSVVNYRANVIEVLAKAGGISEFGNTKKVKIIRKEKGQTKIFYLDISDQELLKSTDQYLMPYDIVIVEPLRVKNFRKYTIQNYSLLISVASGLLLFLSLSRIGR